MEELIADELKELGAAEIRPAYRGVYFKADPAVLYRVNYCSRLASHVLAPLITFACHSHKYLYKTARKLDWESLLGLDHTFVIAANASDSNLHHSQFAAQRLKDAIADHFVEKRGERPSVDRREADLWLNLNIHRNKAIISVDCSGGSLHRRGYRIDAREAPLQETLAAALLRHSGWRGETPLVDPMCGSGTILAEALMLASRLPAAHVRMAGKPPFAHLPDYDAAVWTRVKAAADAEMRELPAGLIQGGDIDAQAVRVARGNLARLPGGRGVLITKRDFRQGEPIDGATIVTNPPYGRRLSDTAKVKILYGELGDFLKRRCTNSTAWILAGDVELVKSIGLRPKQRIPIFNGPLECRLVEIPVY
ncbi:MAG: class I SAM-dependent RNA methyltransferase [Candidatus Eisenbacteria bacterium]|uniref:Class I SAM-dependent RNA methyltransferase n=1 Tax=Eiseniibacteriota bacterium TaxID=2212470 RepID=A0A948W597_UNCEI|nr:class I SAM-dependent RNA methyltransferase [Candidatus Eisenbacteria bacterium]MBU1948122.1 class I SAM-dependent RNA methyltransferase [Candidatus Eisenbacteria bacterium]MBU2689785.1 class I SAM-dependent RNA methyltransferase [Candidatus Eisenbacteria bacterium]